MLDELEFRRNVFRLSALGADRLTIITNADTFEISEVQNGILYFFLESNGPSVFAIRSFTNCLAPFEPGTFDLIILQREKFTNCIVEMVGHVEHGVGHLFWVKSGKVVHEGFPIDPDCSNIRAITERCFLAES